MKYIYRALTALLTLMGLPLHAQEPATPPDTINLNEIVISANKVPESRKTVPQQVTTLTLREIRKAQAQTTADLVAQTGQVFVQKSQMGGGSPVLRGLEANRILLVVDGVRMNNLIYRAGHLQNIITLDPSQLERVEVLFGPSSSVYGSDALGGVIHVYTRQPRFAENDADKGAKVEAFTRYGSVNQELTGHASVFLSGKRIASLTSFTYARFDDLKGGKNLNPFYKTAYGLRPFYAERINGKDSLVANERPELQVYSGYSQYNLIQKLAFRQSDHVTHSLNLQYSSSTNIPRYDRLTDPQGAGLRFAEWYYGPQLQALAAYDLLAETPGGRLDRIHFGASYQRVQESRHNRRFGRNSLGHRTEDVQVAGLSLDLQKRLGAHTLRFGLDGQYNTLASTAEAENIVTGERSPLDTRYPDGDNVMIQVAAYGSHSWEITPRLTLSDALRLGYASLRSTFVSKEFFPFPYGEAHQTNPVYSANLGLVYAPGKSSKLSALLSTGYRVPNVDDLGKVFESAAGSVIVPNPDLKPEQSLNFELGATQLFGQRVSWENVVYATLLSDAIVTSPFTFNGQDSIIYDGALSRVLANQNERQAYIMGFTSTLKSHVGRYLILSGNLTYTYGRIRSDGDDLPLDHIPPLMARVQASYSRQKFGADFFAVFHSAKKLENYYLNGEDNEQYATPEGMPAWFTLNLRASYALHPHLSVQAGVDNLLDTQYRVFASGINAPGRNIFVSLRLI